MTPQVMTPEIVTRKSPLKSVTAGDFIL